MNLGDTVFSRYLQQQAMADEVRRNKALQNAQMVDALKYAHGSLLNDIDKREKMATTRGAAEQALGVEPTTYEFGAQQEAAELGALGGQAQQQAAMEARRAELAKMLEQEHLKRGTETVKDIRRQGYEKGRDNRMHSRKLDLEALRHKYKMEQIAEQLKGAYARARLLSGSNREKEIARSVQGLLSGLAKSRQTMPKDPFQQFSMQDQFRKNEAFQAEAIRALSEMANQKQFDPAAIQGIVNMLMDSDQDEEEQPSTGIDWNQ